MRAQVISFHCTMKNRLGQTLSSSFNQNVINQVDRENDRLRGLVDGLQSVRDGEKRKITVSAEQGYGNYDPRLVVELRRSELNYGDRVRLGSEILRFHEPTMRQHLFRVTHLDGESVVIDANHPLAGQDLVFEVEIVSARDAQSDDLDGTAAVPHALNFFSGHLVH